MFTIDFNPIIVKLGPLAIRWYGLSYIFGFLLLYLCLRYCVKKELINNFGKKDVENYILYVMLGGILGARIFYFLFYDISTLFTNPLEFFMIWHGGMSFHGGLVGAIIATIIFSKKYKVNFFTFLNVSSVVGIFALMIGRIANLINGELVGTRFDGSWCAVFANYDSVCRHPYPIYAAISHFILLLYLVILIYINRDRLKEFLNKKSLTINFIIGYGILRIITDIWKLDSSLFGIKTGQWLSLFMILLGFILIKLRKK